MGGGGGRGSSLFSYVHVAWTILGVQKNEYFRGYEETVDILGGHYIGLIWGIISIHFRAFFC